jgi:hypothetical protein
MAQRVASVAVSEALGAGPSGAPDPSSSDVLMTNSEPPESLEHKDVQHPSSDAPEPVLLDGWSASAPELAEHIAVVLGVKVELTDMKPLPRGGYVIQTKFAGFLVSKTSETLKISFPRGKFVKNMVILRGVSPMVNEKDFLVFADPKPVGAERFHGMPIVKLIFDSEELTKKALSSGVTFGHSHYGTEPFVDKRSAFCRKCKSLNKNHTDCELRCGKCGESHVTKECPGGKTVCVNCPNPDEPHDLFHCPKVLKKERDVFQKVRKSYAETVSGRAGKAVPNSSGGSEMKEVQVQEKHSSSLALGAPAASLSSELDQRLAKLSANFDLKMQALENSFAHEMEKRFGTLLEVFQVHLSTLVEKLNAQFNLIADRFAILEASRSSHSKSAASRERSPLSTDFNFSSA